MQQSVKIKLVINLNTAKAFKPPTPPTLLAFADEAIELPHAAAMSVFWELPT